MTPAPRHKNQPTPLCLPLLAAERTTPPGRAGTGEGPCSGRGARLRERGSPPAVGPCGRGARLREGGSAPRTVEERRCLVVICKSETFPLKHHLGYCQNKERRLKCSECGMSFHRGETSGFVNLFINLGRKLPSIVCESIITILQLSTKSFRTVWRITAHNLSQRSVK